MKLSTWLRELRSSVYLLVDGAVALHGSGGFMVDISMLVGKAEFPPIVFMAWGQGLGLMLAC